MESLPMEMKLVNAGSKYGNFEIGDSFDLLWCAVNFG